MVLLPAAGVFLAKYLYKEEENESKVLRKIMFGLCLFYLIIIILNIVGIMSDKALYWASSIAANIGSIVLLIGRKRGKDSEPIFNRAESVRKTMISIPIIFPLCLVSYFGEEYGWRGFLQERMQNKFGKRLGVVLLGVVWEIPFRFAMTISMAIFLGYIFMKTRNVWLCSLVHCHYLYLLKNIQMFISRRKIRNKLENTAFTPY